MTKSKILFLSPYPENVAPSQRLKYEQYYKALSEKGFEITTSSFISGPFWKIIYKPGNFIKKAFYSAEGYFRRIKDLFRAGYYDVVYVHLWGTPFGAPVYEWLLTKFCKRLVYDIDDLVYLKNTGSKAHPLVSIIKGRNKPLFLMKHADHVITCTPYLDKFVRQYNENTTDISSTVDTDAYQPVNLYTNNQKITLGWSGSVSTAKYFYLLEKILKRLKEKYEFDILVMGDPDVRIEGLNIKALAWSQEIEIPTIQKFDIGLYPLPDEEWVYGKSGLKAIQYMAFGIPTVAQAIGANFRVIENDVSGFLVSNEDEWVDALSKLIENADLRRRIGQAARQRVLQQFSIEANTSVYENILRRVSEK